MRSAMLPTGLLNLTGPQGRLSLYISFMCPENSSRGEQFNVFFLFFFSFQPISLSLLKNRKPHISTPAPTNLPCTSLVRNSLVLQSFCFWAWPDAGFDLVGTRPGTAGGCPWNPSPGHEGWGSWAGVHALPHRPASPESLLPFPARTSPSLQPP